MGTENKLDRFRDDAIRRASLGICEGTCEQHFGEILAVRVHHKDSGRDWGYFSYCECARDIDINNGMGLANA